MAKNKKEMPIGVKIISILGYIGAAFGLLAGILMMIGSAFLGSILTSLVPEYAKFSALGTVALIVGGIVIIVFSVLAFFIAKGLWEGKNWARITTIVFTALGFITALTSFDLVSLLVDGVIIWYLAFNKPIIKYFK